MSKINSSSSSTCNTPINNKITETFKIINCPCRSSLNNPKQKTIKCMTCNQHQHENCLRDLIKVNNYQCPNCQFKEMDPFIKTVVNILPSSLFKYENKDIKNSYTFTINKENCGRIEEYFKNKENKNSLFIMIRSLRLDEEGYEHHWPLNFSIIINGQLIKSGQIPKFPPRSRSRVDFPISFYFKQEDVNINHHSLNKEHFYQANQYINFSTTFKNNLEIVSEFTKNDNDKFSYIISIDLIEIFKDSNDVIQNISKFDDPKILSQFFNKNNQNSFIDEICSSEKVSLIDCYTRCKRIMIPARSINCLHMSVFDLKYFLAMSRKNKNYACPLCRKKACRLYVDGVVEKILKENLDVEDILLSASYDIVIKNKEVKLLTNNIDNTSLLTQKVKSTDLVKESLKIKESDSKRKEILFFDLDLDEEIINKEIVNKHALLNNVNNIELAKFHSVPVTPLQNKNSLSEFKLKETNQKLISNLDEMLVDNDEIPIIINDLSIINSDKKSEKNKNIVSNILTQNKEINTPQHQNQNQNDPISISNSVLDSIIRNNNISNITSNQEKEKLESNSKKNSTNNIIVSEFESIPEEENLDEPLNCKIIFNINLDEMEFVKLYEKTFENFKYKNNFNFLNNLVHNK